MASLCLMINRCATRRNLTDWQFESKDVVIFCQKIGKSMAKRQ
jgi:hypothetical protein